MTNNDILKRLRFALDISDFSLIEMVELGGKEISELDLAFYFKKEDEEDYKNCSNSVLVSFLDGLILKKRGPRKNENLDTPSTGKNIPDANWGKSSPRNNSVMKKLRIALELKEVDIIEIFRQVDFRISKSEISALFRRSDHKNFRECGDQMLRNFIQG
ncbi:MAG: DUF1456 family protein, partial [Spirochaetales bacterium]|nr:DUF1456 family protein [Spirochaetales bacterium]